MMKLQLQFFGGRGSAGGNNPQSSNNTQNLSANKSSSITANVQNPQESQVQEERRMRTAVSDTRNVVYSNLNNMFYRTPEISEGSDSIRFHLDHNDSPNVTAATVRRWFKGNELSNNFDIDVSRSKHISGWHGESDGHDYVITIKRKKG